MTWIDLEMVLADENSWKKRGRAFYDVRCDLRRVSEKGNVERSAMRIDNCFDDTGVDVMTLGSSCVEDMVIWDESNDHIGCRVLLRWSDCGCIYLLRCFCWGDKFGSYHIGGRRMKFGFGSHFGGIGIVVHDLVGRISG